MYDGHEFALCLTHDVDRPYKTFQSVYRALTERDTRHLRSVISDRNPYWQFEDIMALEADLGVRSAFYFLQEQHPLWDRPLTDWVTPEHWRLYVGRYSLDDPAIVDIIRDLDAGGWEVGLHGSYESYRDKTRLRTEKHLLETVLGHEVIGGRQHYLNLAVPETWRYHAELGLRYDASLGSATEVGFHAGYDVHRPFGDAFVVFPLTIMESALPGDRPDSAAAWSTCERLLEEARTNGAVMTVLWHPRFFSQRDFPGYTRSYRRLVETALDMGAWVGPPGRLYETLEHPGSSGPVCTDAATE